MHIDLRNNISFFVSLFIGFTFAYLLYALWRKIYTLFGDSWTVIAIAGLIVVIGMIGGFFGVREVLEKI